MQALPEREDGFTLLEILIVVSIIGLLMAVVANQFLGQAQNAQIQLADANITKLSQALEIYRLDNGRYPTTEQGLEALVSAPTIAPAPRRYAAQGYAKRRDIVDPWSGAYQYEAPGRVNTVGFDLCSFGPDGVPASGSADSDDICNYDAEDRR